LEAKSWKSIKTWSANTLSKPTTLPAGQIEQIGGCFSLINPSFNNKPEEHRGLY